MKVSGGTISFSKSKDESTTTELDIGAKKKFWDKDSFSMLRFLIVNGCPRSLAEKFLSRSKGNLFSKIQK